MTFLELQQEVKRRATRNQGGDQFDTATKNAINASLFRVAREAKWRQLRRKTYFTTVTSYDTGSGYVECTSGSTTIVNTSANFYTDGIEVGRRVKISGDSEYHYIREVTGETSFVIDTAYAGTSNSTATYEILPQDNYNLPIQCGHGMFLWHEEYGYPLKMCFSTDQEFYNRGRNLTQQGVPVEYKMWGEDMLKQPILTPTNLAVFSSDTDDMTNDITVFGTAEGYPDSETIRLSGTSVVTGTTTFSAVDRIVKNSATDGRVSITASGDTSIVYAVLPKGDITDGIMYKKIQIYPLPDSAFDINVYYYKEPYRLVNDGDVHELGQEYDEAIILLSVAKINAESHKEEAAGFLALYQDEIRSLKKKNVDKIDWFPKLQSPFGRDDDYLGANIRYSQFGPYYGRSSRY